MYFRRGSCFLAVSAVIQLSLANPVVRNLEFIQEREADDDHFEWKRTVFPDSPPSCPLCERNYDEIDSCANASVVLANVSQIMFNPLAFLDVIGCACTDTFQSTYPQCVDCFTQTNQTGFLVPDNGNLSSVITGMRQICALGSSIFGHVASVNSQLPGETPITVPSEGAALRRFSPILRLGLGAVPGGDVGLLIAFSSVILGFGMGVWTVL